MALLTVIRLKRLSAGMVDGLRSKTAMLPPATVPMMAQPGARVIPMELEW